MTVDISELDLTPRETDVAELVVVGFTNPMIADKLGIANSTVKMHVKRIFQKADVNSRVQLVKLVYRG